MVLAAVWRLLLATQAADCCRCGSYKHYIEKLELTVARADWSAGGDAAPSANQRAPCKFKRSRYNEDKWRRVEEEEERGGNM